MTAATLNLGKAKESRKDRGEVRRYTSFVSGNPRLYGMLSCLGLR